MKRIVLLLSVVAAVTLTSCKNPEILNGLATVGINYAARRNALDDDAIEALRVAQGILMPVTAAKNPPRRSIQP